MLDDLLGGLRRLLKNDADDVCATPESPLTTGSAEGVALVYRGPAASPGCPESVAAVLRDCGLDVTFVGPGERVQLDDEALASARVYAQPGGDDMDDTWPHMSPHRKQIKSFVKNGGVYLGFCLGGYLAGKGPGFKLLPGDTDQYIVSRGATVDHGGNDIVTVDWRGRRRDLFFQDGPYFAVDDVDGLDILARYTNGLPAALVVPVGAGVVGVTGPHPEASRDWFVDAGLRSPRPSGADLAKDLILTALARQAH